MPGLPAICTSTTLALAPRRRRRRRKAASNTRRRLRKLTWALRNSMTASGLLYQARHRQADITSKHHGHIRAARRSTGTTKVATRGLRRRRDTRVARLRTTSRAPRHSTRAGRSRVAIGYSTMRRRAATSRAWSSPSYSFLTRSGALRLKPLQVVKCALLEVCTNAMAEASCVPRATVFQPESAALYAAASSLTSSSVPTCRRSSGSGESSEAGAARGAANAREKSQKNVLEECKLQLRGVRLRLSVGARVSMPLAALVRVAGLRVHPRSGSIAVGARRYVHGLSGVADTQCER